MYISANNKNTYTPGEPLAEVRELQIKKKKKKKSHQINCTERVDIQMDCNKKFYQQYIFIQIGYQLLLFSLFITNRHFPEETTST